MSSGSRDHLMLSKIKDNIWSFAALAIIGAALLMSRGGLAALMPVVRLLVPLVIVYFIFKFIEKADQAD